MTEEATVDCYDEDEQVTGLFTMIEDTSLSLSRPRCWGPPSRSSVDRRGSGQIVAVCSRDGLRQAISILDLSMR